MTKEAILKEVARIEENMPKLVANGCVYSVIRNKQEVARLEELLLAYK